MKGNIIFFLAALRPLSAVNPVREELQKRISQQIARLLLGGQRETFCKLSSRLSGCRRSHAIYAAASSFLNRRRRISIAPIPYRAATDSQIAPGQSSLTER